MARRPERISSLNVERGLYVLRYIGASAADHPVIYVRSSPGNEDVVSIVGVPGDPQGRLGAPGAAVVIVASEPAALHVTAQASSADGSLNAEVRLESLIQSAPGAIPQGPAAIRPMPAEVVADGRDERFRPSDLAVLQEAASAAQDERGGLNILAHVARLGDVASRDGSWVGGPDAPAPIEGLALDCQPTVGVIQYQVLIAGESRWSEWLASGSFGGSRGRAKPLTGVRVRLVPAADTGVHLNGEALFLGSAILRKEGLEMEFRSAAGLDPLVGLRLALVSKASAMAPLPGLASMASPNGRVRVFKASGRRSG